MVAPALIAAVAFIVDIGYRILNTAKDAFTALLAVVQALPNPFRLFVYLILFCSIIAVLSGLIGAYNSVSPLKVSTCITTESMASFFSTSTNVSTSTVTATDVSIPDSLYPIKWDYPQPGLIDRVLLYLHPECTTCVASGWTNSTACDVNVSSTATGKYFTVEPRGNYSKSSCSYIRYQGDVYQIYLRYAMCQGTCTYTGCGLTNFPISAATSYAVLMCDVGVRAGEIYQVKDTVDIKVPITGSNSICSVAKYQPICVVLNYFGGAYTVNLHDATINPNPFVAVSRGDLSCHGIDLLDYKKWAVISVLGYMAFFAITYYSSIWNMLAGLLR